MNWLALDYETRHVNTIFCFFPDPMEVGNRNHVIVGCGSHISSRPQCKPLTTKRDKRALSCDKTGTCCVKIVTHRPGTATAVGNNVQISNQAVEDISISTHRQYTRKAIDL